MTRLDGLKLVYEDLCSMERDDSPAGIIEDYEQIAFLRSVIEREDPWEVGVVYRELLAALKQARAESGLPPTTDDPDNGPTTSENER